MFSCLLSCCVFDGHGTSREVLLSLLHPRSCLEPQNPALGEEDPINRVAHTFTITPRGHTHIGTYTRRDALEYMHTRIHTYTHVQTYYYMCGRWPADLYPRVWDLLGLYIAMVPFQVSVIRKSWSKSSVNWVWGWVLAQYAKSIERSLHFRT